MSRSQERAAGRAGGKVILLGEHAVVYGRPAIAAGLPDGAVARAQLAPPEQGTTLAVSPWNVQVRPDPEAASSLARAFAALVAAAGYAERAIRVEAEVALPGGSGLGSSAALGVAVLRAIDAVFGRARNDSELLEILLAWERVFHGQPSGVDGALAIAGGLGWYVRGQPLEPIAARRPLLLVVGDSGEPCSTRVTVGEVARQRERNPERMDATFDAIAAIVRNGRLAIEHGDHVALGQLMDMNQSLLAGMMVSTPTLEEMIGAARAAGALGAKLTGGGGGGCMIALAADEAAAANVERALLSMGKRAFVTRVGERSP